MRNRNENRSFWIISYKIGSSKILYRIIDDKTGQVIDELNDVQALKQYRDRTEEYTRKIKDLTKDF